MFAEALTINAALLASHCVFVVCFVLHGSKLQLSLVVCQEKNALKMRLLCFTFHRLTGIRSLLAPGRN
jgi:hypothetical protein